MVTPKMVNVNVNDHRALLNQPPKHTNTIYCEWKSNQHELEIISQILFIKKLHKTWNFTRKSVYGQKSLNPHLTIFIAILTHIFQRKSKWKTNRTNALLYSTIIARFRFLKINNISSSWMVLSVVSRHSKQSTASNPS